MAHGLALCHPPFWVSGRGYTNRRISWWSAFEHERPQPAQIYLERFSTLLQAPDFDFSEFPLDAQAFFIRIDLLAPEWLFSFREIEGYSEVGEELGEEEWVATGHTTPISQGAIYKRPVSRFNVEFIAKRHVEDYIFRILLPLCVIISVSWVLFFLEGYAKRVDAAGANLLLFIAFNFTVSRDLPRLGYLTFLDTLLISAFLVTAVVLILSVYLRRQDSGVCMCSWAYYWADNQRRCSSGRHQRG